MDQGWGAKAVYVPTGKRALADQYLVPHYLQLCSAWLPSSSSHYGYLLRVNPDAPLSQLHSLLRLPSHHLDGHPFHQDKAFHFCSVPSDVPGSVGSLCFSLLW
jgi:hypothetical protein